MASEPLLLRSTSPSFDCHSIASLLCSAAAELADINEDLEPLPRRGLRSSGPVLQPPPPSSRGPASRAGSEAPAPAKPKPSAASLLPNPKDIRREHT